MLGAVAWAAGDYPVRAVPFTAVRLNDGFWAPRLEVNRSVTLPFALQKCEETGRVENFERAAAVLKGESVDAKLPPYPFDDTDLYKLLEAAAYSLRQQRDAQLESRIDGLILKIAAAQEPDGYLYPARTINPEAPHAWAGAKRWELEQVDSHELYNLGHLFEAAAAYFQATGKRTLLDVATRGADLLDRTFGPGKRSIWPGHQVTEMGLVRLYQVTGQERYLKLARFLIDARGPDTGAGSGREYNQSHRKLLQQDEAVGHAVRATYLYAGAADVAALAGAREYVPALERLWANVVGKKLYVTGGIGATGRGEAFGTAYELPNRTAYCETCAAIGSVLWNQRMFLLQADGKYVDVLERTLYNGLLSGVSLDGKAFFYPNPLESRGQLARSPWFGVACCPGNIARFLPSMPGYLYGTRGDAVYVNLYASGTAEVLPGVELVQETRYPWDGGVTLRVSPRTPKSLTLNLRIPGWARNQPVPSELYRFWDANSEAVTLKVNGKPVAVKLEKGYAAVTRVWTAGDVVQLRLPMPVRRLIAHPRVEADRDRIALQRGPLVYCLEGVDQPAERVRNLLITDSCYVNPEHRSGVLGGVTVLKGRAAALARTEDGEVEKTIQEFTAVPYYAWANRGAGEMAVWIPRLESAAQPLPAPTLATRSTVRVSSGVSPRAINDGIEPKSSGDEAETFFHWWPSKGTTEWVELTFPRVTTVSEAQLYWFDDTGRGECRVPASWRLFSRDGDAWKPVKTSETFGVEKDRWNRVEFEPRLTTGLRLEVTLQPGWSAGIQEWKVE